MSLRKPMRLARAAAGDEADQRWRNLTLCRRAAGGNSAPGQAVVRSVHHSVLGWWRTRCLLSGAALLLKPDFLALILLYWCIQEPRLIGVGIAWCVGLLMDVTDATVFGQHALGVCGARLRRRVFSPARAAISAVAAGGAGRGSAPGVFGAGAGHSRGRRSADSPMDLRRGTLGRRTSVAAHNGRAAGSAAAAPLGER